MAQTFTQYGGIRPFGISFLLGGIDRKGVHLYKTEPSGIYFEFKAKAIGIGSTDANKLLESKYKRTMNTNDGLKLAIDVFKKVLGKDFEMAKLETAIIRKEGVKELHESELKARLKK
jgi:proteasome alpha subunit